MLASYTEPNFSTPGLTKAEMSAQFMGEQGESVIKSIPLGRVGTPEGIATAAVFLASDFSDYITGVITDIDGDFMMDKMELGDNIFKHF